MFKGHWIVADVDGTLLPTPSKVAGGHLSFTGSAELMVQLPRTKPNGRAGRCYRMDVKAEGDSPEGPMVTGSYPSCLPALLEFISAGGSLCVVSTAGARLWQQVYWDLTPALFPLRQEHQDEQQQQQPGQLLICGFTGAAMFRSRDPAAVAAEWPPRDRELTAADKRPPDQYEWPCIIIPHLRTGDPPPPLPPPVPPPPPSVGLEEWAEYRTEGGTTLSTEAHRAALEEGCAAIIRFMEHAARVNGNDMEKVEAFFTECLSARYVHKFTASVRISLEQTCCTRPDRRCFEHASMLCRTHLLIPGWHLKNTNEALVDCQRVPSAGGDVGHVRGDDYGDAAAPVAQVVLMGIPMKYFNVVFPRADPGDGRGGGGDGALQCCQSCLAKATSAPGGGELRGIARLEALGLAVVSQPNSVCIRRAEVDKGSCIRWLAAHRPGGFSLDGDQTITMGDVPASVDRPLAAFPPVRMVSLSQLPDEGCRSAEDLAGLRAHGNIVHVGGEEEGGGYFLDALLEECRRAVPSSSSPDSGGGGGGGTSLFTAERIDAAAAVACAKLAAL